MAFHAAVAYSTQRYPLYNAVRSSSSRRVNDPSTTFPEECTVTSTSLPDSLIATLPGSSYTDPGIFAQEQERVFETMWFCVARGSELARPGAFRTVDVGRESILLTQARDNPVRAYFNVCRHRGAKLRTEETGEVKRAFQCPYHAWTYDLNGKLVAAPNLTKMPDVGRTEYGLVSVAVREWLGYVWVCLAENPPSFEEDVIGDVVARLGDVGSIEHYDIDNLSVGKRIVYDVKANWKLIIENFMECYHCATIHPELTEVLPEFADGYAAQYYVGHGAEFGEDVQGFTVDGSEGLDRIPGVAEDQDRRYYAITVKPQVFINLVPDHVIFHRMYPVAADRTIVECDWLYLPRVVESGKDVSRSVELFHRVNQQDFEACERTQPAMSSRMYAKGGVLVPSEHHIGAFHDWVNERLDSPSR
jgi:glycine betaine catabolism A